MIGDRFNGIFYIIHLNCCMCIFICLLTDLNMEMKLRYVRNSYREQLYTIVMNSTSEFCALSLNSLPIVTFL